MHDSLGGARWKFGGVEVGHFGVRHHHFELAAKRLLVEAHGFGAVTFEEDVGLDVHGDAPWVREKDAGKC